MAKKKEYPAAGRMFNPPHPGRILKHEVIEALGLTIKEAAEYLDVDRVTLSRVVNCKAAISVEMALRIGKALNGSPDMWIGMQNAYDFWQAEHTDKIDLSRVRCFESREERSSV